MFLDIFHALDINLAMRAGNEKLHKTFIWVSIYKA